MLENTEEEELHNFLIEFRQINNIKNILNIEFCNQVDIKIINNHRLRVKVYPRLTKYFKHNVYVPFIYNHVCIEVVSIEK